VAAPRASSSQTPEALAREILDLEWAWARMTNVTHWVRMFRPPLQRAFDDVRDLDLEMTDLLRRADERREHDLPELCPEPRGESRKQDAAPRR
jgi:hypothetical protein